MKNQAKEIFNHVKAQNQPLTFAINSGNEQGIKDLISELDKLGVNAELVLIEGTQKGLYVSPRWDDMIDQKALEEIETISPVIDGVRTLKTPASTAISEISWDNGDLTVIYKSNNHIPYKYQGVPEAMFNDLVELEQHGGSVGSYIARQIKPFYSTAKAIA